MVEVTDTTRPSTDSVTTVSSTCVAAPNASISGTSSQLISPRPAASESVVFKSTVTLPERKPVTPVCQRNSHASETGAALSRGLISPHSLSPSRLKIIVSTKKRRVLVVVLTDDEPAVEWMRRVVADKARAVVVACGDDVGERRASVPVVCAVPTPQAFD